MECKHRVNTIQSKKHTHTYSEWLNIPVVQCVNAKFCTINHSASTIKPSIYGICLECLMNGWMTVTTIPFCRAKQSRWLNHFQFEACVRFYAARFQNVNQLPSVHMRFVVVRYFLSIRRDIQFNKFKNMPFHWPIIYQLLTE